MVIEVAAVQSPVIPAIKDEFGSVVNAQTELANVLPAELINQILPAVSPVIPGEINDAFAAALEVGKVLRDDSIEKTFSGLQPELTGQTVFQAQLFAQSIEVDATRKIAEVEELPQAATRTQNLDQIQTPQVAQAETFNQLVGNIAYQNIQAVVIPEPAVANPPAAVFSDEVKEVDERPPARPSPGFGDQMKNSEAFAALQDFLTSLSPNAANNPNPVEQTISSFTPGLERENTATSLLV